jgi:ferredoxin--NADP+ reductase
VFEKRFAPHGVVRAQVAPDHQNIKRRAALPDYIFEPGDARYFGNVEVGRDVGLADLRTRYDAVLLATGSERAKRLGVPGSAARNCFSAAEFVAWYNGEQLGAALTPDLDVERAIVVGMGHVAIDIARILTRHPSELEPTDIAVRALRALGKSRVREVVVVARRGPDQTAFEDAELLDLMELVGVGVGRSGVSAELARAVSTKRGELILELPEQSALTEVRRIVLRFTSAIDEIVVDETGRISGVRIARTRLVDSVDGFCAVRTGEFEEIEAGLVIEALGNLPEAIDGVPFDRLWARVPNDRGRVLDADGGDLVRGLYVAGSLKERPLQSIEQNRLSARETVAALFEDLRGQVPSARGEDIMVELGRRGVRYLTWWDWGRLDQLELKQGRASGKVRQKIPALLDALQALSDLHSEVRASPAELGLRGEARLESGVPDADLGWSDESWAESLD